jgi:hypothetical protein
MSASYLCGLDRHRLPVARMQASGRLPAHSVPGVWPATNHRLLTKNGLHPLQKNVCCTHFQKTMRSDCSHSLNGFFELFREQGDFL